MNSTEIKQTAKRQTSQHQRLCVTELTAEFLNEVVKGIKRHYVRPIESEVKSHIEMVMLWGWERGEKCLDDNKMNYIYVIKN